MVFPWVFHQPNYIGNEDVVVGIDDGEVEGHFIFSVEAGSRNARFIANKDKVREILKALLDE